MLCGCWSTEVSAAPSVTTLYRKVPEVGAISRPRNRQSWAPGAAVKTEPPAAALIRASEGKDDGLIRVPAGGRAESGALVRIRISPAPGFAGSVNQPVYVAPAASRIVSPGCAWSRAACRSPPGGTSIIPVKCGRPVWAAAVAVRITLSAIRNGSGRTNDAGGIIHDTVRPTRIR